MRTRTLYTPVRQKQKVSGLDTNLVPSKGYYYSYGQLSSYNKLPMLPKSINQFSDLPTGSTHNASIIIDAGTEGDFGRINEVSHVKVMGVEYEYPDDRGFVDIWRNFTNVKPANGDQNSTDVPGCYRYRQSQYDGLWQAFSQGLNGDRGSKIPWSALTGNSFSPTAAVYAMHASTTAPADRLGEVPARAIAKMEQLNLANSLYETKDFPELAKLFSKRGNVAQSVKNITDVVRKIASGSRGRNFDFKKAVRALCDGQLGYSYGLAPTVDDVKKICKELSKGIKRSSRTMSVQIRSSRDSNFSFAGPDDGFPPRWFQVRHSEKVTSTRVDGCRILSRRPEYYSESFQKASDYIDGLIGINPYGLVWRQLPLSFVVDWFLSIDDVIDNLFLNKSTDYEVQYWSSTKEHATIESTIMAAYDDIVGTYNAPVFKYRDYSAKMSLSSYNRVRRDPPSLISSIRLRGDNLMNGYLLLLMALGMSKKT